MIESLVVDRTGAEIAPVPDLNWESVTYTLNDSGESSFGGDPLADNMREIKTLKREIQLWEDGTLRAWHVPWTRSGNPAQVTWTAEGVLSLFKKRFVTNTSLLYTSIDQLAIGWDLLRYAQDAVVGPFRDFNIDPAVFALSGVVRSRNYEREDHSMIYDLIREFPDLENGFDFEIVTLPTGQRLWTPHYPRKGEFKPQFRLYWEEGGERANITFEDKEDATPIATKAYAVGGSAGDVRFEENWEDLVASEEYGVMESILSEGDQKDVQWLEDRARSEVNLRKAPLLQPTVTIDRWWELPQPDGSVEVIDMLDNLVEGDSVPLLIDHGAYDYDATYRIYSRTWNISPDNISITFLENL